MRPGLLTVLPLSFTLAACPLSAHSQQTPAPSNTAPAWLSSLTAEQRAQFDDARKSFNGNDFVGALPKLRHLHEQVPQNDGIAKLRVSL